MADAGEKSQHIVLIHGLFLTHKSWEHWVARYRDRGYIVHTPAWPGLDAEVADLRRNPEPLTKLDIKSVLDYLVDYIERLGECPIVMGHSFGGLFAQLLAYRNLASVAVGIDPTAPAGVLTLPFSTLKASSPVLANPFNLGKATMLTPDQFHYAFTNTLDEEASLALYDQYAIPCANRVLFEGAFENFAPGSAARIDVSADRPPILLIAGGADHLVTAGFTHDNFRLIEQSPAITAFKEFSGRPHFTTVAPGWEAVADYALDWAVLPVASRDVSAQAS
jgi:pimeloyl-ACP methyl ester carboxylesterase